MPILQTLVILLSLLAVVTLLLLLMKMKHLRKMVKMLPPLVKSDRGYAHHLVGVNLRDFFEFPVDFQNSPVIVAFASPTCMSCFKHMKDYLNDYGDEHRFLCILRSEGDEIDARFLGLYGKQVPILKTTADFMKNVLRETKTPLWLVVDKKGVIVEVEINQTRLVHIYNDLLSGSETRKGVRA